MVRGLFRTDVTDLFLWGFLRLYRVVLVIYCVCTYSSATLLLPLCIYPHCPKFELLVFGLGELMWPFTC